MTPSFVITQKSRWVTIAAGIALTALLAVLFFVPPAFMETISGKLYDLSFRIRGPMKPPADIAIVAVDDDSLARVGRWPWPRSTCAALIDRLAQGGAKVIALDVVFLPDPALQNAAETAALQAAIGRAGNVILPFYFEFGKDRPGAATDGREAAILSQSLLLFDDPRKFADYPPPSASNLFAPAPDIAQGAKALGHINVMADPDGTVRRVPMIIRYRDAYYPSFPMQVVTAAFGLTRGDITVRVGDSIRMGKTVIPTDTRGMALLNYYGANGTIRHVSAADVLDGKTKDAFQNRIVFVGITAAGMSAGAQDLMATPFSNRFPGVEKHAQEAASMLQGRFLTRPVWVSFVEFGLLLTIGLLLSFVLPFCRPAVRLLLSAGMLVLLGGASIAAFYSGLWLKILFPAVLVLLLYLVSMALTPRPAPLETGAKADSTIALRPDAESIDVAFDGNADGPPKKIGRYEILSELGQGAMGIVYQGRDPIISRPVAIKTIRFDRLYEAGELKDMKARFFKEAQAAGSLIHPGIVTVFDVGDEQGLSFIAMEYVEGKDLARMTAEDGPPPWRQACSIIRDAALALDFAHRQGVVHRDIKPANIMLTKDGQVKVMDFGIAKVASSTLTQAGAILGTPAYMSPEHISGIGVDSRSDLFSLGSVLYELLTGSKPFSGDDIPAIWHRILEGSAAPPSSIHPGLPSALDALLDRALAKAPEARYQSGKEMADALHDLIQAQPQSP